MFGLHARPVVIRSMDSICRLYGVWQSICLCSASNGLAPDGSVATARQPTPNSAKTDAVLLLDAPAIRDAEGSGKNLSREPGEIVGTTVGADQGEASRARLFGVIVADSSSLRLRPSDLP